MKIWVVASLILLREAWLVVWAAYPSTRNLDCLQARHVLCLQARHLLCLQPRHLLCQQTRDLQSAKTSPGHCGHRGGRFAAAPVWAMKRGCLGRLQISCLLTQQMSWLQTQQMSCLQTQQMSCLQTGQGVQGRGLWGQGCAALHPKAHLEKGKLVFARGCSIKNGDHLSAGVVSSV